MNLEQEYLKLLQYGYAPYVAKAIVYGNSNNMVVVKPIKATEKERI